MREELEKRLEKLKAEFESGHKMLADLDARQANIKNTLLRISGAIQVLEEELARENKPRRSDSEEQKEGNVSQHTVAL